MKTTYFILALLLVVGTATAQRDKRTDRLEQPAQSDTLTIKSDTIATKGDATKSAKGSITCEAKGDAKAILDKALYRGTPFVEGFRIAIFMGNGPGARGEAAATQAGFRKQFPGHSVYLSYENPYFKVIVGAYPTKEEAILELGRIRQIYPKAFVMHDKIPISQFAR